MVSAMKMLKNVNILDNVLMINIAREVSPC